MTIYEEFIERVHNGESFNVDFENRTIKVGKTKLVDNGEYDKSRSPFKDVRLNTNGVLEAIEYFYHDYKHSLPSERNDGKRKRYFKALSMGELSDENLMVAERREIAQAKLEGFILCMILTGQFKWTEDMGKWFWQSKQDNDLVILKRWVENK